MSRSMSMVLASVLAVSGFTMVYQTNTASAADKAPAATFEVYKDKGGEFRWRLRAQNSQILAIAPDGYKEKRSCLSAIESIKHDVPTAPVKDQDAK